jgi:hypothetical protein
MASYKNRTRKRSKKTYRKKYRKTATKRMMGGGGLNPFSTLFSGISGNFSLFKSNAKQETAATIAATKAEVAGKIAEAKTTLTNTKTAVADRAKCIAACAK